MKVAVPKEILPHEHRVALIPDSVKRLIGKGLEVVVESGAGAGSFIEDNDFLAAGARIESSAETLFSEADIVLKVQLPGLNDKAKKHEIDMMREGAALIAFLQPLTQPDLIRHLARKKITAFSMEMIPRTTLAQSMDVLSSMSTISGYKAVVVAADLLPKFFPMFMTAAGTVSPAKVLIIGTGVAGLQAIATAKRLGGLVEAFDQRPAAKEQVQSLGVKFVEVPLDPGEQAETTGGYAKELSEDYRRRQAELIHRHIVKSDVVIPTALIPGKRAPILITEPMVKEMKAGSVIVDVASDMGGNCELTEPGKTVVKYGVTIVGLTNIPSSMPVHASQMYSRNIEKFLLHLADKNGLKLKLDEEITKGSLITHQGAIVHPLVKELSDSGKGPS